MTTLNGTYDATNAATYGTVVVNIQSVANTSQSTAVALAAPFNGSYSVQFDETAVNVSQGVNVWLTGTCTAGGTFTSNTKTAANDSGSNVPATGTATATPAADTFFAINTGASVYGDGQLQGTSLAVLVPASEVSVGTALTYQAFLGTQSSQPTVGNPTVASVPFPSGWALNTVYGGTFTANANVSGGASMSASAQCIGEGTYNGNSYYVFVMDVNMGGNSFTTTGNIQALAGVNGTWVNSWTGTVYGVAAIVNGNIQS